jgi:hypothetical protein
LLWELVPGILASGSLRLSEIARTLVDRQSQMKGMEKHLSCQLASGHWDHRPLADALLADQAREVQQETVIPIDFSDLAKPYGRKLEYIDRVSDRSDPDHRTRPGYWVFEAYRAEGSDRLAPLLLTLFSNQEPGFRGQNVLFDEKAFCLRRALDGRGIWVLDRGFDGRECILTLLRYHQPRWIVRERGDRHLVGPEGRKQPARQWAQEIRRNLTEGETVGSVPVYLSKSDRSLQLITSNWKPQQEAEPWILLSHGFDRPPYTPTKAIGSYARRWRAEDGIRFGKQRLGFESFMVQEIVSMRRLLLMAALGFVFLAELLDEGSSAVTEIERAALHFDEPTRVRVYLLARGLQQLATRKPLRVSR